MRTIGVFATACAIVLIGIQSTMAQTVLIGFPTMPTMEATAMDAAMLATPAIVARPAPPRSSTEIVASAGRTDAPSAPTGNPAP